MLTEEQERQILKTILEEVGVNFSSSDSFEELQERLRNEMDKGNVDTNTEIKIRISFTGEMSETIGNILYGSIWTEHTSNHFTREVADDGFERMFEVDDAEVINIWGF